MLEIDPFMDDFIIMGSDGLFDKFTSQDAVNFVSTTLKEMPPTE